MLLSLLVLASQTLAATIPDRRGELVARECYAGESKTLFCYKQGQGTPQDVAVDDIAFAATALREW